MRNVLLFWHVFKHGLVKFSLYSIIMLVYVILELIKTNTFILTPGSAVLFATTIFIFQGISIFQNNKLQNIFNFFASKNKTFDHEPVIISWEATYFLAFVIILSAAGILFLSHQYVVLFSVILWLSWWAYYITRIYYKDYMEMTKQFFINFINTFGGDDGKTGNSN